MVRFIALSFHVSLSAFSIEVIHENLETITSQHSNMACAVVKAVE